MQPKVSIIVPVYNSEKHLDECLESIVNQTLKEIEIICVDDGSEDSSYEKLTEWTKKDSRIKRFKIKHGGTGHAINTGVLLATGKYIGEVDADDFIDEKMYETLYSLAEEHNAEVVKSGYYSYFDKDKDIPCNLFKQNEAYAFKPIDLDYMNRFKVFGFQCSFWSAIYKTTFLKLNGIKWRETPGASFQDTSVIFKVNALVERMVWTGENFYHWRCSEPHTVTSKNYPFAVIGEYHEIERFLEERPRLALKLRYILSRMRFGTYYWNYFRLDGQDRERFCYEAAKDLKRDWDYQDIRYYGETDYTCMHTWMEAPFSFHSIFGEVAHGEDYSNTANGVNDTNK